MLEADPGSPEQHVWGSQGTGSMIWKRALGERAPGPPRLPTSWEGHGQGRAEWRLRQGGWKLIPEMIRNNREGNLPIH